MAGSLWTPVGYLCLSTDVVVQRHRAWTRRSARAVLGRRLGADVLVPPSQAGSTVHKLLSGRQAWLILSAYTPVVILLGVGTSKGNVRAVEGEGEG